MMRLDRASGVVKNDQFASLAACLQANDLLIFNDTKVFPARLFGHKDTGGKVECLVERIVSDQEVLAHVRSVKALAKMVC